MSKITAPVSRVLIACLILTALPRAQVGRHVSQSQGTDKPTDIGAVEVLTDTQETDVQPCLERMVMSVRENWFRSIPERVGSPVRMRGKVVIEFVVKKNGHIGGMKLVAPSGNVMLDRAA